MRRSTATVECPRAMVGRVIGKNGETIKALQSYSGALIQIDQTLEPTKVTISGTPHSLSLAVSMVNDIVKGTFKGFALLRQVTQANGTPLRVPQPAFAPVDKPRPVYAPGYGFIPPSQLYGGDERAAMALAIFRGIGMSAHSQQQFNWPLGQGLPSQMFLGPQQAVGGGRGPAGGGAGVGHLQSMQQGYGLAPPYGSVLPYYPQEYLATLPDALPITYDDPSLYMQQQQPQRSFPGDSASQLVTDDRMSLALQGAGGHKAAANGLAPQRPAVQWLPADAMGSGKIGSSAVHDLLGPGGGDAANLPPMTGGGPDGNGNLVVDRGGQVFFYNALQDV